MSQQEQELETTAEGRKAMLNIADEVATHACNKKHPWAQMARTNTEALCHDVDTLAERLRQAEALLRRATMHLPSRSFAGQALRREIEAFLSPEKREDTDG